MKGRITTFTLALAAFAAACGDHVQEEMATTAVQEAMRPEEVDTVTAAWLAEELVQVTVDDRSIRLEPAEMPAGQITFRVLNTGRMPHELEVEGEDGDWEVEGDVAPGEVKTLTVTLQPGTYEVYCPLEDEEGSHAERGMRATLTVR